MVDRVLKSSAEERKACLMDEGFRASALAGLMVEGGRDSDEDLSSIVGADRWRVARRIGWIIDIDDDLGEGKVG